MCLFTVCFNVCTTYKFHALSDQTITTHRLVIIIYTHHTLSSWQCVCIQITPGWCQNEGLTMFWYPPCVTKVHALTNDIYQYLFYTFCYSLWLMPSFVVELPHAYVADLCCWACDYVSLTRNKKFHFIDLWHVKQTVVSSKHCEVHFLYINNWYTKSEIQIRKPYNIEYIMY